MSQEHQKEIESLDGLILQAAKKIGAKKENDICRYLPSTTGGYIHHFTMRKMKTEAPEQLRELINKFIVGMDKPTNVRPKQRATRGSRKRNDQFLFTKQDIERVLHMARLTGDKDIIRKFTPKKDLRTIKRELISSIRHGRVEQDLWLYYIEAISASQQAPAETQLAHH